MPHVQRASRQYYTDFEFWSASEQLYWFPLHIMAKDEDEAAEFLEPVKKGLESNYRIIRTCRLAKIVRGLMSESVTTFRTEKLMGIPNLLDANLWTMSSIKQRKKLEFRSASPAAEHLAVDLSAYARTAPVQVTVDLENAESAARREFLVFNVVLLGE